ncbi:MAG: hypothetical protein KDD56_08790 [Bdellovibrionales bacterium]|nr:hypothetical protein [Bdellovibrionales bacterium]
MAGSKISDRLSINLNKASNDIFKSSSKLASGKRVNNASDDAAGLAIINQLSASIDTSAQAVRNISDGFSLTQIADGTLSNLNEISTRQAELATQAANGTLSDEQRATLNQEFQALEQEKQRLVDSTEFNGRQLFNQGETDIQVDTDGSANSSLALPSLSSSNLTDNTLDISTASGAQAALGSLDSQIAATSSARGELGALQSRLATASENLQSRQLAEAEARGRIEDVNVADETAKLVSARIRQDFGTALSAQANLSAKTVSKLISGG